MMHSADWVPAGIRWDGASPLVEWCHLGELRPTDPFFEQTIDRAMRQPFNLLFSHRTPLGEFAAEEAQAAELNLAGLIFHMSRCGSTVVSRMLAALERNVVLSEPAPLDQVVRLPSRLDLPPDALASLMRGMVAALGRKRRASERDLFIKLDAWHVLLLPLFRRAFPNVPWIFIYREPLEVIASLIRSRPTALFPNWIPASLLSSPAPSARLNEDEYAVLVLANYLRAAIEHRDGGLLVEYGELPDAACMKILDHFGLRYGEADRAAMHEAAMYDSKSPKVRFRPDGAPKRQEVGEEIRLLTQAQLAPLYRQLEALRLGARPS
jgi:hypothetical protein